MTTSPDPAISATRVLIELSPENVAQHPDNLRDPGRDLKALTASVQQVGVLVPLIVVPVAAVPGHEFDPAVTHVALDGSRRQAAARAAGLPLPCEVRPDLASARDTAVTMAVTGLVRDGLTAREEAGAVQTMLDLGISQTAIGRATGRSRAQIGIARKAASITDELAAATGDYPLTLQDMAILADWQEEPDAVAALLEALPHGRMDHVVARLNLDRRERELYATTAAELAATGIRITDTEPRHYGTTAPRDLLSLRAPDSPPGECLTPQSHATCPGHVAHIEVTIYDDPGDDDQDDTEVRITFGCTDPQTHGHAALYGPLTGTATPAGHPGEDEHALAERETREAQEKKDARRSLIRLNKEADAARAVRRKFLRQCLTTKTRHKQMTGWAISQILRRDRSLARWIGQYGSAPVLGEILGCEPHDAIDTAVAAPANRHPIMLWAYTAAAYEDEFHRDAHRQVCPERAGYLRHLAGLGYTLSDVEQQVIDNTGDNQPNSAADHPASAPNEVDAEVIPDTAA